MACFRGGVVGGTSAVARLALARCANPRVGEAFEIALGWTTLAARDLLAEADADAAALEAGDLALAHEHVACIVGRDTAGLDARHTSRVRPQYGTSGS